MVVIDNFIKDNELLAELANSDNWKENLPSMWFSRSSDDKSMWFRLVKHIWSAIANLQDLGDYEGFEVWSQVIDNRTLDWHQDKDEYLWVSQQKLVTPTWGSIYYAHSTQVEGGFLEIKTPRGIERLEPVPNRLIIHNPANIHRVCFSGRGRRSLLSNLWSVKPLEENFKGINYGNY